MFYDPSFHENLALKIDPNILRTIANNILQKLEPHENSLLGWKKVVDEAIPYLGMPGKSSVGSANPYFKADKADYYSPTFRERFLLDHSFIYGTIFSGEKFVDTTVIGQTTPEAQQSSETVGAWYQYYFDNLCKEYKSTKSALIYWCSFSGSAFSKTYIDPIKMRPVAPFVWPDDLILDSNSTGIHDSEIFAQVMDLSDHALRERVRVGQYINQNYVPSSRKGESLQQKSNKTTGQKINKDDFYNKRFVLYETFYYLSHDVFYTLNQQYLDGRKSLPYIVTIDSGSQQVVGLYRNWSPNDIFHQRLNPYTQYKYIDDGGPYGRGSAQLMVDLARAETSTTQSLLKAAQLSNDPPLVIDSSSLKTDFTEFSANPGKINRVDTLTGNVGHAVMPLINKEPSQTLLSMSASIADSIRRISITKDLSPESIPANMAATTMMGVLSTLNTTQAPVISRIYDSLKNEAMLFFDLFARWVPDNPYRFSVASGEYEISKADFNRNMIVHPTFDKNAFSQTSQLMLAQSLMDIALKFPSNFNPQEVAKFALKSLRISQVGILKEEKVEDVPPLDPLTENIAALQGKPIKAYKWQDHKDYIIIHQDFIQKLQQQNPDASQDCIAALSANIQERQAMQYMIEMEAAMQIELPEDLSTLPVEMQNEIAVKAAESILKQQEIAAQSTPTPVDPSQIMQEDLQVKKAQYELQREKNEQQSRLDLQKLQNDHELNMKNALMQEQKLQLEQEKFNLERERFVFETRRTSESLSQSMLKISQDREKDVSEKKLEYDKLNQKNNKDKLDIEAKVFDNTLANTKDNLKE